MSPSSSGLNPPDVVQTPTLNEHDYLYSDPEPSAVEMLEAAQMRIAQLEAALEQKAPFTWLQIKPDSTVRFYTGFPTFEILVNTFNALQPTAENMYSWSQIQRLKGEGTDDIDKLRSSLKQCKLSLFDQFYLVLQKLRVGTFNQVLADNFKISLPTVSRIFISWINFLYFMLGSFCIWPTREKIRQHAPACFRVHYPRCRGIIDATEIKV